MICVPIKKKTFKSVLDEFKIAQKTSDIVEIWFEEIKDLKDKNLQDLFKAKKKPILYKSFGDLETLKKVLGYPVEYLDLDIKTTTGKIKKIKALSPKTKLIISYHDFEKTPKDSELKKIADKISSKGADLIKIATTANSLIDSMRMLNFLSELSKRKLAICLCMGSKGKITRAAGHLFGNYLMYAPLSLTSSTASGQIAVKELQQIIKNQQF